MAVKVRRPSKLEPTVYSFQDDAFDLDASLGLIPDEDVPAAELAERYQRLVTSYRQTHDATAIKHKPGSSPTRFRVRALSGVEWDEANLEAARWGDGQARHEALSLEAFRIGVVEIDGLELLDDGEATKKGGVAGDTALTHWLPRDVRIDIAQHVLWLSQPPVTAAPPVDVGK